MEKVLEERLANIESLLLEIKDRSIVDLKPPNLTVKEVSEILKVSTQSIHNYIKKGFLPAQKVGRILLIKREDVERSLEEVKSLKYRRQ